MPLSLGIKNSLPGGGGLAAAAPTYTISGTVYDADGSTPVSGATIALGVYSDVSAVDGTYTIEDVPEGTSGTMTCTLTGYLWDDIAVSSMSGNLTGQDFDNVELAAVMVDLYGATEVYRLVDIATGTTIHAAENGSYDGTLSGWVLQDAAGPVTGTLAPSSDGSNDYGDVANVLSAWDGTIIAGLIFGKPVDAGAWSDGVDRVLFNYKVDNSNWLRIYKHGTLGLYVYAAVGGVAKTRNLGIPTDTTGWFMASFTLKDGDNGDELKCFLNDSQIGATLTGFGSWTGTPNSALSLIGALSQSGSQVWDGWFAYHALWFGSIPSPTDISDIYANP